MLELRTMSSPPVLLGAQTALEGFVDLTERKADMMRELAHVLRRYTSLNHLAGAARPVLASVDQTRQMLEDINCIDFGEIQAQVGTRVAVRTRPGWLDLVTPLPPSPSASSLSPSPLLLISY